MIKLCYKKYELGFLSFDEETNEFVYNSNLESEEKFKQNYSIDFYPFFNSKNVRWKNLPTFFGEIVASLSRGDIVKFAGIKKEDSLFVKLEKFAKLDLFDDDFYLKV